ncbi:MAG: polymer-forming cytoskeletal protein [Roseburia sp.]|nr:polymer-forming cytoskeletal protein [Roseburia sp.]
MGFFSDLKEDLSQAVNELMPEETSVEKEVQEAISEGAEPVGEVSLEEMLQNIDSIQLPEEMQQVEGPSEPKEEKSAEPEPSEPKEETFEAAQEISEPEQEALEPEQSSPDLEQELVAAFGASEDEETAENYLEDLKDFLERQEGEESWDNGQETEYETPDLSVVTDQADTEAAETIVEERKGEDIKMDSFTTKKVSDETAVITAGMTVVGDISSEGSIDVIGNITGNIDVLGKINVTGYINGNSKAAEIYAEGAKVNGEVVSEGAVKIGASSVIIGNITAASAAIAGAVKGDIDVQGPVVLDATAIVMGNIKSKSVQINNGAVIEGMCSQCYADVSPTSFFSDYKMDKADKKDKKEK